MHRQEILDNFKKAKIYFESEKAIGCIHHFFTRELEISEYIVNFLLSNFWEKYTDRNVRGISMAFYHIESNKERVKVIDKIIIKLLEDGIPPPFTEKEKEKNKDFYDNLINQHIEFERKLNPYLRQNYGRI